jgi:response regulator of citrate/malate metabolism
VSGGSIRVLVVDDEPITAEADAEYVRRLPGFEVAGVAESGREALRLLRDESVDLVLLDMNLPDIHGLDLCRRIRSSGLEVDVIAITAVRDVAVVRAAVSLGIVLYLIKPFTFPAFAEKLESYRAYLASLAPQATAAFATQGEVDASFATLRAPGVPQLDKGLAAETLDAVVAVVREAPAGLSAGEVGAALELSRVTARRYLEHLVSAAVVVRSPRYGTPGRPELEYRWRGAPDPEA